MGNLLGGLPGAFGQALHFFGHDREAAPGFPGGGGVHTGTEGQGLRALGNAMDELHGTTNVLRPFPQAFDAAFGLQDGVPHRVDALDRAIDRVERRLRPGDSRFGGGITRSGMSWTIEGGQGIVDLRVVWLSGVWDEVHQRYVAAKPLPVSQADRAEGTQHDQQAA